jgi:hypothetical protein
MASLIKLSAEETRQHRFTHKQVLTYADVTGKTSGTAFDIYPSLGTTTFPVGTKVNEVALRLKTLFVSASMTECDITIGDGGDADRFLNSSSIGGTNTPPTAGVWYISDMAKTPYVFTAADTIEAVITVTGGSLATLTAGEIEIYYNLSDVSKLV